jgi:ribosome-associated heat shock protein Hsp15
VLIVRQLGERRGPASVAQTLYEETEASRDARTRLATQLKMAPPAFVFEEKGRPTKKDRRDLSRLIDRNRR